MILYASGPDLRSSKFVFDAPWLLFALNTVSHHGPGPADRRAVFQEFSARRVSERPAAGLRRAHLRRCHPLRPDG
ncbi:MAG: hypothetical protein MZU97_07790 [Bacillus subtilis]|nr:hypothetical protein [Bacillus subtilis]